MGNGGWGMGCSNTYLKNNCNRWVSTLHIQQGFPNPKSKMVEITGKPCKLKTAKSNNRNMMLIQGFWCRRDLRQF
jgi:hypothetical protein